MNPDILNKFFILGRPFSPIYSLFMHLRRSAYSNGLLKAKKLEGFTISVGNITLGGTGKSPLVAEIARFFSKKGEKIAILSRGYGGRAGKGPILVNKHGKIITSYKICGDEPYMLAQKLKDIPIIVGSDRYKCGVFAKNRFGTTIFILDDGFQHIKIKRDLDIVLVSAPSISFNEKVFPGGTLREDFSALTSASLMVITKINEVSIQKVEIIKKQLKKLSGEKPIFLSSYNTELVHFPIKNRSKRLKDIKDKVFAFCGLAEPNSFYNLLKQNDIKISGMMNFKDHYSYKDHDLKKIYKSAKKSGAKYILTTEKDIVKIKPSKWKGLDPFGNLGTLVLSTKVEAPFWTFLEHVFSKYKNNKVNN